MVRFFTLAVLASIANEHGVHARDVSLWQKYQCDLPMENRNKKMACACNYLRDKQPVGTGLEGIIDKSTSTTLAEDSYASQMSVEDGNSAQKAGTNLPGVITDKPCVGGSSAGFPCQNIDLLAFIPNSVLGNTLEVQDLWAWSKNGREFAIVGLYDGEAFIEVTDPINPVYLGRSTSGSSLFRDVKVYKDYAFVVSEARTYGMRVFDLNALLTITTPTAFYPVAWYTRLKESHNIVINEDTGFAYIVGSDDCDGGLHVVNIQNPLVPQYAGCFDDLGYVHDAQCIIYDGPDSAYQNKETCFCFNEDHVAIVDVTDKKNMNMISRITYASYGYTHQGWLTEDRKYLIFGDEMDEYESGSNTETYVVDVASLTNPRMLGAYLGTNGAIDHNLYVMRDYTYVSSYRAGLRVLKNNDLSAVSLQEVAYFDTYPSNDRANYNGAWSVYPFLPSGIILVSSIEQGVFVLKANLPGTDGQSSAASTCNLNGVCDPGENCSNCPEDCEVRGGRFSTNTVCCDGDVQPDCGHTKCSSVCSITITAEEEKETASCRARNEQCTMSSQCCHGQCRSGVCRGRLGG